MSKDILLLLGILSIGLAPARGAVDRSAEVYRISSSLGGVALQPDGKIVVANGLLVYIVNTNSGVLGVRAGGAFRFEPDGTLDRDYKCQLDPANSTAPMYVHLFPAPGGRMLLTGTFQKVDGKDRPGCAMLLPDGHLDESFVPLNGDPDPLGVNIISGVGIYQAVCLSNGQVAVSALMRPNKPFPAVYRLDASGRPLADGEADSPNPRGNPRSPLATLTKDGVRAPAADLAELLPQLFTEVPLEMCRYAVRLPDGGAIVAMLEPDGSHLMRFDAHWRRDFSYTNHFELDRNKDITLVLQPDNKLLVAGSLTTLDRQPFTGLMRLDPTGAIDPTFRCRIEPSPESPVRATVMGMALQPDGRILVVGYFTEVNGVCCSHLARLNPDGSLDKSFQRRFISSKAFGDWYHLQVTRLAMAEAGSGEPPTRPRSETSQSDSRPTGQTVLISSLDFLDGTAILRFRGNASQAYILQATSDLDLSHWISVHTNLTDATGQGILRDPGAGNAGARFYRVATPQ